jgi:hypothetical protein
MIWLTWRQFRTQAWVVGTMLAVLVVALAATAPHLRQMYRDSGLPGCTGSACDQAYQTFLAAVGGGVTGVLAQLGDGVMFLLPPIIGVFWGAPMVARELETGTFRLAWNQSVTRLRWLGVKVTGLGLAAMAVAGLASFAVTWWSAPIDHARHHLLAPDVFAARGVVPVGYAAFAFVVGVTAGLVSRRTVLAMGVTFAVVLCAMAAMPLAVRAHLSTPVRLNQALDVEHIGGLSMSRDGTRVQVFAEVEVPGAWVLSNRTVTPSGAEFTGPCPQVGDTPDTCRQSLGALGLRQEASYIPESRFWPLQFAEAGLFLGLALLLGSGCFWWVRRRLS